MMRSDEGLHFNIDNTFYQGDKEHIGEYYGGIFLDKVLHDIKTYTAKRELKDLHFLSHFSANCIFTDYSRQYGVLLLENILLI